MSNFMESDEIIINNPFAKKSFRKTALVALGLACYLAWFMTSITPTLFSGFTAEAITLLDQFEFVGSVFGIVPLFLLAVLSLKHENSLFPAKLTMVVLGVALTLGTLFYYGYRYAGDSVSVASGMSIMLMGLSVCMVAVWSVAYCDLDEVDALRCVAIAHIFGFLFTVIISILPQMMAMVLHALMMLASTIVYLLQDDIKLGSTKDKKAFNAPPSKNYEIKTMLGILAFAFIMRFLFSLSEGKSDNPYEVVWLLAGAVLCVFLVTLSLVFGKKIKTSLLVKFMLPIFVVGEFLIFAFDLGQSVIEVIAMGCAWIYFRVFYFMAWRSIVVRRGRPAVFVFALGEILIVVAGLMGIAYIQLSDAFFNEYVTLAMICLLAIVSSQICFTSDDGSSCKQIVVVEKTDDAACELYAEQAAKQYNLSHQERIIALMLIKGMENEDIQRELVIAYNTLRTHLRNMYRKTGVHSRQELVSLLKSDFSLF